MKKMPVKFPKYRIIRNIIGEIKIQRYFGLISGWCNMHEDFYFLSDASDKVHHLRIADKQEYLRHHQNIRPKILKVYP